MDYKRSEPTREEWLLLAIEQFRPKFKAQGKPLPKVIRVSVGFPLGSRKAIGQCFSVDSSEDKTHALFISPKLKDTVQVLGTLLHECVHTVFPYGTGHKRPFQELAAALGLEAPWTATTESPRLQKELRALAKGLGKYPHAQLTPIEIKKQGTRMLQYGCAGCKIKLRGAKATLERIDDAGGSHCPCCGDQYTWSDEDGE